MGATPQRPLEGVGGDVNERLQDDVIRHAISVLGLAEGEAVILRQELAAELDPVVLLALRDLLNRVDLDESGRVVRSARNTRLTNRFLERARVTVRDVFANQYRAFRDRLRDIASMEASWAAASLVRLVPLKFDVRKPAPAAITDAVSRRELEGRKLREWFRDLSADTVRRIEKQVRIGVSQNARSQEIIQRVRGTVRRPGGPLNYAKQQVDMIARTAVSTVSNRMAENVWLENDDVVGEVKIVATLDLRTCAICSALDGRTFPLDHGPRPAFHLRCRCGVVPVTKSWEELGIRVHRQNRGASQATRASMAGRVPQDVLFPGWIQRQGHADLVEVFGRTRANWIRNGVVEPRELIDRRLRIRTIAEMREVVGR